jgi:hypothetical protein
MTVACPHCQHAFTASAEPPQLACPQCQHRFANPSQAVQPEIAPAPAAPKETRVSAEAAHPSRAEPREDDETAETDEPTSIIEDEGFVRDTVTVFRWLMTAFASNVVAGTVVFTSTYLIPIHGDLDVGMFAFNMLFQWLFPLLICVQFMGAISLRRRESFGVVQASLVLCLVLAVWWVGVAVFCAFKATALMNALAAGSVLVAAISVISAWFAYPLVMNVDFQTRFSDTVRRKMLDRKRQQRRARRRYEDGYDD